MTYEEIFKLANICPDQLLSLIQTSFEILEPIAEEASVQAPFVNDIAVAHLQGLINEIK